MGAALAKVSELLAARPQELALRADAASRGAPGGAVAFAALIVALASVMLLPITGTAQLAGWAMVGGGWVVGQVAYGTFSQTRFIRQSLELVNSGRGDEAIEYCLAWTRGRSKFPHRLGMIQTAYAMFRGDRLAEALAIFAEVERSDAPPPLLRAARAGVASILAMLGHVEAGIEKLDELGPDSTGLPFARTLIDCCAGRFDEVFALRFNPRSRRVAQLLHHEVRVVLLLRAFAADRTGREREVIEGYLGGAHPSFDGEFDYLTRHIDGLAELVDAIDWRAIPRTTEHRFDQTEGLPAAAVVRE